MFNVESLEERAREVLIANYKATGEKYIAPSWPHYHHQWFWDSCFQAIACAKLGLSDLAKNEIERLLNAQDERGFISHLIYGRRFNPKNWRGWLEWERFFYKGWPRYQTSLVGQPVIAQAMRAIGDPKFFVRHADRIVAFYKYFLLLRDPDRDGLISSITPRESGRDSSPEFDFFRSLRFPKLLAFFDDVFEMFFLAILEARYKMMGWDEKKILRSKIFDVQDLAIQCMFIDGLYDLCWMMEQWEGSVVRFPDIREVILKSEQAVREKCWNEKDKAFYSLRNGNEQLRDLTVASLFPLLIKDLPEEKLGALVTLLRDDSQFNASYPVPSVSLSHPKFNASRTWPLWRGPTWINTNWFIIRGLMRHNRVDLARRIAEQSIEMVRKNGFYEFYDPLTGRGLRAKNFGWSTLVVTFQELLE